MRYLAGPVRSDTLVHAAVDHLDFGYVEMTDDVSDFRHVLANRYPPAGRIIKRRKLSVQRVVP